MHYHPCN
ncbi:hypothetical protein F383_05030 [Gossypium arboreum]|nr:hypothetical protein F383_05030 [Gossypium arboreum]